MAWHASLLGLAPTGLSNSNRFSHRTWHENREGVASAIAHARKVVSEGASAERTRNWRQRP